MPSPRQSSLDEKSRRSILYLTAAWVVTLVALASLGLSAWSAHRSLASFMRRALRIEAVQGRIIQLDEVLTMSARMAAATGDLAWEERYLEFVPELEAALAEAQPLVADTEATDQTDAANQRLIEMEGRAFDLVRQDQASRALEIMLGQEYAVQKSLYAQGMADFHDQLEDYTRSTRRAQERRTIVHIAAVGVAIPVLVIVWVFVLRMLRESRSELLRELIRRAEIEQAVASSTREVASAAGLITASAQRQEEAVQGFRAATGRAATAVHEIAGTATALTQTMHDVSGLSRDTADRASAGRDGLDQLGRAMNEIREATDALSARIDLMTENAGKINVATRMMIKVADQTDLLSVNSAIEAEKAGDQAQGFRVVSREIRRLADHTAEGTVEIESIVDGIHESVSGGVNEISRFAQRMQQSVAIVRQVADELRQIIVDVGELSSRFASVSEAMVEQTAGTDLIRTSIRELDRGAEQFSTSSAEFAGVTERLRTVVRSLEEQVSALAIDGVDEGSA